MSETQESPFTVLDLEPTFHLPGLVTHALTLQQRSHPDRFVGQPERQLQAEKRFARIVWAYEELRDLRKRAQWLFQQVGFWPLPQDPDTIEAMMELEDQAAQGTLSQTELQDGLKEAEDALRQACACADWPTASKHFTRMSTFKRLVETTL